MYAGDLRADFARGHLSKAAGKSHRAGTQSPRGRRPCLSTRSQCTYKQPNGSLPSNSRNSSASSVNPYSLHIVLAKYAPGVAITRVDGFFGHTAVLLDRGGIAWPDVLLSSPSGRDFSYPVTPNFPTPESRTQALEYLTFRPWRVRAHGTD